jgi:hypothetical protein
MRDEVLRMLFRVDVELVQSRTFSSKVVFLRYRVVR